MNVSEETEKLYKIIDEKIDSVGELVIENERLQESLRWCVRWIEFTVEEPTAEEPADLEAWRTAKERAHPRRRRGSRT